MNFILTTCGTSILTNRIGNANTPDALNDYANERELSQIPAEARKIPEDHLRSRKDMFCDMTIKDARNLSAELSGLLSLYDGQLQMGKNDQHWLLASDTWQGEATAQILIWQLFGISLADRKTSHFQGISTRSTCKQ